MDLRLLEIFCYVFRERSFSRAARLLGLTQPTVSSHIKDFEAQLGTPLFVRMGREIEPTDAGYFLYENAQSILTFKQNLNERFRCFLNRIEGSLVVGASSVPGEYLLPGIVASFQTSHPAVRARLRIKDTAETIEAVRAGEVHLGVVGARVDDDELDFREFASDRLVLAVPTIQRWLNKRQIRLAELCDEPLIVRELGSGTRTILEQRLAEKGRHLSDLRLAAELGSTAAVKQAIKEGVGISFISELAIRDELEAGTIATISVRELDPIPRTYYIVLSRLRILSPLTEAFLETLEATRSSIRQHRRVRRAQSGR